MKILVIDDEQTSIRMFEDFLLQRGYEVTCCSDAQSALQEFQQNEYPLVITDIIMPGMDGLELCRRLRTLPGNEKTVILGTTAYEKPETLEEILDAGADDYLVKPNLSEDDGIRLFQIRLRIAENLIEHRMKQQRMEQEMHENEVQLRQVIDLVPHMIFAKDQEGKFIMANIAAADAYGLTPEKMIDKTVLDLKPLRYEEYQQGLKNDLEIIRSGEAKFIAEETFTYLDGNKAIMEIIKIPFVSKGTPAVLCLAADISERKQIQAERDRFFNLSIDMLCIVGFDGYFKQINPAWTELLDWSETELFSKCYLNFIHPDDRQKTIKANSKLDEGELLNGFENRFLCKDGSYRWISWNAFPLLEDNLVFAVARDITEHKRAEEVLQASEERYRTVFENSGTAIGIFGEDSVISMCNSTFEKLSGYTKDEIEGRLCWHDFIPEDDRIQMVEYHKQRSEQSGTPPPEYDCYFIDKSGNRKYIHVKIELIPATKNRIVSLLDITERQQAEQNLNEKLAELEKYREVTIGRELRMVELKEKIRVMEQEIGRESSEV